MAGVPIFTDIKSLKDYLEPQLNSAPWKHSNIALGIATGCFDMTHIGHANYFREAKDHCRVLVAAVAPDSCIQHRKGVDRPIESQKTRCEKVAQSPDVDAILMIGEGETDTRKLWKDTFLELRPNIVFRGPDAGVEYDVPSGTRVYDMQDRGIASTTQMVHSVVTKLGRPARTLQ